MARRIAYLGPAGTFTEEAALHYDPQADLQPFPTISAVGLAVNRGTVFNQNNEPVMTVKSTAFYPMAGADI